MQRTEDMSAHIARGRPIGTKLAVELSCLVAAIALWFASLSGIDPEGLNDYGLIAILPPSMWAAYALGVCALALVLLDEEPNGLRAGLSLATLVAMLHATPSLVYGTLRYSWAWKHLGIVDYIQRHNALDPTADFLAAYHNWPALFVFTAELSDLLGLNSIELSRAINYTPLLLNILFLILLPIFFRKLTDDNRTVWMATAFFIVGNWVGQDYFSPQGVSFLAYLAALILCLGAVNISGTPTKFGWHSAPAIHRLQTWATSGMPTPRRTKPIQRIVATVALMSIIVLMVATHQLTPILLISALAGLVVLHRTSAVFLLFAIVAEITWLLYFASPFTALVLPELLAEFGNTAGSVLDKMANLGTVSQGQFWVSAAARSLTAFIALVALVGDLFRLSNDRRDGVAIWLVLAPMPLIVATSYGGEILFRVYFYALPGLSFFAATIFAHQKTDRGRIVATAFFAIILMVLIPAFILANNGKDRQYRFTHQEVELSSWLYQNAPPGSLLIEGSRSYPSQFINYENFAYLPISEESTDVQQDILRDPAGVLGRWLERSPNGGFVFFTSSQKASIEDTGIMPEGSVNRIIDSLTQSPKFIILRSNEYGFVFTLSKYHFYFN